MKKQNVLFSSLIFSFSLGILASLFIGLTSFSKNPENSPISRKVSFDTGWRFLKDSIISAENPDFNDTNWRILDVPHDWSIEDLPGQNGKDIIGPFTKSAVDKMSSGYLTGGVGWYRKSFTLKEEDHGKIIYLEFDGVYMNSDVWLNGKHLGLHPYGYTPFNYDITPFLNPAGKPNVVAVRVRNQGFNSRWYSGSGITRHVWLTMVNPVHIDVSGGLYVTTPLVSEISAEVKIAATIVNTDSKDKKIVVQTSLFDPSGKQTGTRTPRCMRQTGDCSNR